MPVAAKYRLAMWLPRYFDTAPRQPFLGRVVGLDAWRGSLLAILGILVHCADSINGAPVWAVLIVNASHAFRMEAFFAISGFIAALTYTNRPKGWLKRRSTTLLVPFLFVAAAFMPWVNIIEGTGTFVLFHLWFLPTLMICSLVTPIKVPTPLIVAAALITIVAYRAAMVITTSVFAQPILSAIYFVVFYVLGQQFYLRPIRAPQLWLSVAAFSLFVGIRTAMPELFEAADRGVFMKSVMHMLQASVAFLMAAGIMRHALTVNNVRETTRAISKASYTIYLLHFPVLITLYLVVGRSSFRQFAMVAVATFAICLAAHFWVVERYPMAAFLLNGRSMRRSEPQ